MVELPKAPRLTREAVRGHQARGGAELGVAPLSEDEAMRLAVEEQHAWRRERRSRRMRAVFDPNVLISATISAK